MSAIDPTELANEEQLLASAINVVASSAESVDVERATSAGQRAACAVISGLRGDTQSINTLRSWLDDDDLAAQAASWALAHMDSEAVLLEILAEGSLDEREHAYRSLAGLAARDALSPAVAPALHQRIDLELDRATRGLTSLAELATLALAVIGDDQAVEQIQRVIETDPLADRYELQRQRKQVENGGRDRETQDEYLADWTEFFADSLMAEAEPATDDPVDVDADADLSHLADGNEPEEVSGATPNATETTANEAPAADGDGDAEDGHPEDATQAAENPEQQMPPVDWDGFFASPEFATLDEQTAPLLQQLAPMIDQLTMQVARMPLTGLSGQELAGLMLQVLPQAAPPQVVQAALSPQALNGLQAVATYLVRTGAAADPDLVAGVKMIRETMREQIRQSGMLGGPDYSDPDEATVDSPAPDSPASS